MNQGGPAPAGEPPADVSATRLYLGNLPRTATRADVEEHFSKHGSGKITEVKLMNGFGFLEYDDPMDARDVVPAFHGTTFMGERLVVQFARGSRRNEPFAHQERPPPRPRRTAFRMNISGLPTETSWQDLKDFARQSGQDVVYSEVSRERDGRGFVEYETMNDLRSAVEKLNNREFKNHTVHCESDPQPADRVPRDRYRSRSPPPHRRGPPGGYPPGQPDDYEYRRPRGYSPRRDDYRRRSPPRDYYERDRYARSPPARGAPRGPVDDYPPRRYPDESYDARGPPTRRPGGPYDDPYMNGHGSHGARAYAGAPSPRRRSPARAGYDPGYDRRGYW